MADGPVFHVEPVGSLAHRMIQYMVALRFASLVPGSRIANVHLPEWGIEHPPIDSPGPVEIASQHQHVDMAGLTERARSGESRRVIYNGFGQRLENFPDVDFCRRMFRAPVVSPVRFDERYLVCHVRANEILYAGADPNYPLAPVEFYAGIVEQTGLIPVFMGQTAPNPYMDRIRARFPRAVILETRDTVLDFETIRQAKNIVFGVSIFAWLAAWLSHADRIFMAVNGLFNPMQYHLVDLLPFGDSRYYFHLFPINYAVPHTHHAAAHRRIAPFCRQVSHEVLLRQLQQAPRFDPPVTEMLAEFDPDYYLASQGDVAAVTGADNAEGARHHYQHFGVGERRPPFRLSPAWYAARYPMAALEVAQGDYSSFAHHYVAEGRARGYQPLPDDDDSRSWWDTSQDVAADVTGASIAALAEEVVWLEREEPLGAGFEISLGNSFAKLLPRDVAGLFARRKRSEPMRTFRLHDVVLDTSMMALFSGHRPIPETLYMMSQDDYDYALVKPLHPEPTDPARHYVLGANVSADNYYHWMTQSLPAIDWGLRNRRHPNVALALPALEPWQEEALALLGHAGAPRLTLEPLAHYALASAEYSEFLGERLCGIVSHAAAATYARLRQAVAPAADGGSEIYVARTDSIRRVAVNEAGLIAMLECQGVRIVVPGTLSVARQIAIFRRARLVIGPHGAGMSNIMACEPGSHVYELVPSHYPNICFNRLAQDCGLNYWGDVFPGEAGEGNPHDRNWRIDLDVVAARLVVIRARIAAAGACSE